MRTSNAAAVAAALLVACIGVASAVDFLSCGSPQGKHANTADFSVSSCNPNSKVCRLKKKTDVQVELKVVVPEAKDKDASEDIKDVKNSVHAKLLGVPFPFLGVDGTSACDSLFNADGSKAGCPLKRGQSYIYKNSFKIHEIYPKVRLEVHWELKDDKGKSLVCFEVPARIVS